MTVQHPRVVQVVRSRLVLSILAAVVVFFVLLYAALQLDESSRERREVSRQARRTAQEQTRARNEQFEKQRIDRAVAGYTKNRESIHADMNSLEGFVERREWGEARSAAAVLEAQLRFVFESSLGDTSDVADLKDRLTVAGGRIGGRRIRPTSLQTRSAEILLAQIDRGGRTPSDDAVRRYARLLDTLESRCTDSRTTLGDMTVRTTQLVKEDSGNTVTNIDVLEGMVEGTAGLRSVACGQYFAALIVLIRIGP